MTRSHPADPKRPPRSRAASSGKTSGASRVRVLCVEDDDFLREGLCRRLEDEYDVSCASNGVEALEVIKREPPFAVVLSDMDMPDMNGVEFLSHVKNAVRIILTGHEDMDTAIGAINVGRVHRFLTKPCSPQELLETIQQALETEVGGEHDPLLEDKLRETEEQLTEARGLTRIGAMARSVSLSLSQMSTLARGVANAAAERTRKKKPLEERDLRALDELAQRLRNTADRLAGFSTIADRPVTSDEKAPESVESDPMRRQALLPDAGRKVLQRSAQKPARQPAQRPARQSAAVPVLKQGLPPAQRASLPRTSRHTMDPLDLLDARGSISEIHVDVELPNDPTQRQSSTRTGGEPPRAGRAARNSKLPRRSNAPRVPARTPPRRSDRGR